MRTLTAELRTMFRLLAFSADTDELREMNCRHLILGLCCTWLAGMGRWWEDPRAGLIQHMGVGSILYVFVLALFLWLVLWPMNPPHWSYRNVLTFVSLTSLPALLYAIPVRHGLPLEVAQIVRLWLLAIVAGWRVLLLAFYLRRGAGMSGGKWFVAAAFPLLLIVFVLTLLNLEKVVFSFMGGIGEADRSANDAAYGVLFLITMLSFYLGLPLGIAYLIMGVQGTIERFRRKRAALIGPVSGEEPGAKGATPSL